MRHGIETWDLRPDWSSLRICGFKPNHAAAMSFVDQQDARTLFDKCPRSLLKRAVDHLQRICGGEILMGFEVEFVLLDETNNVIKPMDRLNGYSRTAGLRFETLDLVEEIVHALELSSINIHHYHAEVNDQLEIALAPEPALQAVDSLVLAQETIRTVCMRRKIKATTTPKPTLAGPSNGLHLHLSIAKLQDDDDASSFLAGVLQHMRSLCAIGMANYDSYIRSVSDATGAWIGYGTDNRDLPVRKISDRRWEFRMFDGTANPYLFAAAVLFAAIDGLEHGMALVWKDCKFFPDGLDEEKRKEFGMNERMPTSLKEALGFLKKDESLKSLVGDDLLRWYISVKEKEVEHFQVMTEEERRVRFLDYF